MSNTCIVQLNTKCIGIPNVWRYKTAAFEKSHILFRIKKSNTISHKIDLVLNAKCDAKTDYFQNYNFFFDDQTLHIVVF